MNICWKDWCWSWSSGILVIWCEQLTHWKIPWCWERLTAEGEEAVRGWDGWMASPMQWTWTWANFGRWWGTERPGVLQSMRSQRVGHDWVTEQQQQQLLMLTLHLLCFWHCSKHAFCIYLLIESSTTLWDMVFILRMRNLGHRETQTFAHDQKWKSPW